MKQRRYSVDEIDSMRRAVSNIAWRADPSNVEGQLRTYMLNGTDPAELVAKGEACLDARARQ